MNTVTISKPHLCTKLEIWAPKYNDKSLTERYGEFVALLHKGKVDFASPVIIIVFSKAKHLAGQRFCIRKDYAQKHNIGTNRKAPMYEIPMSHFNTWDSAAEVRQMAFSLFP